MSLRLYTKQEFESELSSRLGLERTDKQTATTRAWKTKSNKNILVPKNGVSVPDLGERFPDSWFAEIYRQIENDSF